MQTCEDIRLRGPRGTAAAQTSRYDEYLIVHVGKTVGGFGKRFLMLVDVLSKQRPTRVENPVSAIWHLLRSRRRGQNRCVVVYYDVLAPFTALAKALFPGLTVVYMVRGDQVTWARFQRRRLRAAVAHAFQKWMARLGCVFVFASDDLRTTVVRRLGPLQGSVVLPNTVGHPLPPSRPFDGRIAVVGDFGTVKNIEPVLDSLGAGRFHVDLFGNTSLPARYRRPWLCSHGPVDDLPTHLRDCSLLVLSSVTEGFPNVIVEALEAGCAVVAPDRPPFEKLPLGSAWRYADGPSRLDPNQGLASVLSRILVQQPDFRAENRELYDLIESDWEERIWETFA